jgi:hypothetical protein
MSCWTWECNRFILLQIFVYFPFLSYLALWPVSHDNLSGSTDVLVIMHRDWVSNLGSLQLDSASSVPRVQNRLIGQAQCRNHCFELCFKSLLKMLQTSSSKGMSKLLTKPLIFSCRSYGCCRCWNTNNVQNHWVWRLCSSSVILTN